MAAWDEITSVALDLTKVKKRARPDMEWLYQIINNLCTDPALTPSLPIYRNPLVYESGGRIHLKYCRRKTKEEQSELSIRSSPLIQEILQATETPVVLQNLVDGLIKKQPSLEKNKLQGMIELLLKQQFLCFSLYPSLLTESPFDDLLSNFSLLPFEDPRLKEIAEKIKKYNNTQLGEGTEQLLDIKKSMETKGAAPNLVQVDSFYSHGRRCSTRP